MRARKTRARNETALVGLAVLVALGVSFVAVAQHTDCSAAGYALERTERRCLELEQRLETSRRHVAALRAPIATLERARNMGLALHYPDPSDRAAEPPAWLVSRAAAHAVIPDAAHVPSPPGGARR